MSELWLHFWEFWLIVSAISFAGITIRIAWKGLGEIRDLVRGRR
jgi:hypothetical protein